MMKGIRKTPVLWMLAATALLLAMLVRAHLDGAYDPARQSYGTNYPGDLARTLWMGAGELVVLVALLQPWSYRHSVGRAGLALVAWLPWVLFTAVVCMHCGAIGGTHVLWRFGVAAGLLAALVVSAWGRFRMSRPGVRDRRA